MYYTRERGGTLNTASPDLPDVGTADVITFGIFNHAIDGVKTGDGLVVRQVINGRPYDWRNYGNQLPRREYKSKQAAEKAIERLRETL